MNNVKKIFTGKLFGKCGLVMGLVFAGTISVAHAAIDNTGCDNENNLYITPELALCSTHVYNIGDNKNPENDATKQLMKDVVALKSTIITQQMYAQYEFLETTLKRLKTQLQKEVLLAKLEAAGAVSKGDSSGSYAANSNDKNVVLIGAKNCQLETSGTTAVLKCIQNNINIVLNAVSSGNVGEARRQLSQDLSVAETWGAVKKEDKKYKSFAEGQAAWAPMTACDSMQSSRDNVTQCAYLLNAAVIKKIEAMEKPQNNQRQ